MDNLKVSRNPRTPSAGKVRSRIAVTGAFAALSLALAGCGGGTKNAYQSVDSELEYFGWIVVDGDAVTFIDPDSDGVQQAISDIEENQINPDSDAYDVERGALNESKDMVSLEGRQRLHRIRRRPAPRQWRRGLRRVRFGTGQEGSWSGCSGRRIIEPFISCERSSGAGDISSAPLDLVSSH